MLAGTPVGYGAKFSPPLGRAVLSPEDKAVSFFNTRSNEIVGIRSLWG